VASSPAGWAVSRWILYSKPECGLCEVMQSDLAAVLGERSREVQVVDISGKTELESRFGSKIPVLTVDDEIVCVYRINEARVRNRMNRR
jgi:hypothetical protein